MIFLEIETVFASKIWARYWGNLAGNPHWTLNWSRFAMWGLLISIPPRRPFQLLAADSPHNLLFSTLPLVHFTFLFALFSLKSQLLYQQMSWVLGWNVLLFLFVEKRRRRKKRTKWNNRSDTHHMCIYMQHMNLNMSVIQSLLLVPGVPRRVHFPDQFGFWAVLLLLVNVELILISNLQNVSVFQRLHSLHRSFICGNIPGSKRFSRWKRSRLQRKPLFWLKVSDSCVRIQDISNIITVEISCTRFPFSAFHCSHVYII